MDDLGTFTAEFFEDWDLTILCLVVIRLAFGFPVYRWTRRVETKGTKHREPNQEAARDHRSVHSSKVSSRHAVRCGTGKAGKDGNEPVCWYGGETIVKFGS
jgi:hypothetical protein